MNLIIPILLTTLEVITLEAKFGFLKLGELRLEAVDESITETVEITHYRSIMTSNPALKFLFVLEDKVESWVSKDNLRPIRFARYISEKNYKKEEVIDFDWEKGYVFYPDSDSVQVDSSATDILTLFYKIRQIELKDSFDLIVHAGKVDHTVPCKKLDKKVIKTPLGNFSTVGIKLGTSDKGIFGSGDLEIWLTDDEEKLPILVKANFKFGSVSFRIISYYA